MTACARAALRTGRAVPGARRGREAFEVLNANCKIGVPTGAIFLTKLERCRHSEKDTQF